MESIIHRYSGLHRLAIATMIATFFLILIGADVTSHEAGDSVPDWPLAFGRLVPWAHLQGGAIYEYTHRVIGAIVGLLMIALTIGLWRKESRRWVRFIGGAGLILVILQGVMGGIRVLLVEYRLTTAIIHALLAQLFLGLVVSLVVFTSPAWFKAEEMRSHRLTSTPMALYALVVATLSLFVQLVLGAAFRHGGLGILPHIIGAVVVTVLIGWALFASIRTAAQASASLPAENFTTYLTRPVRWAIWLMLIQLASGIAAYLTRLASMTAPHPLASMIWSTITHVTVGAAVLAVMVVLTLRMYRFLSLTGVLADTSSTPQGATP